MAHPHPRVTCDECRVSPIVGPRLKCNICNDFDLCAACFDRHAVAPGTVHDATHSWLRTLEPHGPARLVVPTYGKIVHIGITCDGCRTSPVAGTRFKCAHCLDFDLCTSCYSRLAPPHLAPPGSVAHDASHAWLRFDYSGPDAPAVLIPPPGAPPAAGRPGIKATNY